MTNNTASALMWFSLGTASAITAYAICPTELLVALDINQDYDNTSVIARMKFRTIDLLMIVPTTVLLTVAVGSLYKSADNLRLNWA